VDKPIRILILEDNPADAELVQFELEEAGINFTAKVVMTEKDFIYELQESCPDIILSDYDLPKYSGALALAETRRRCPDTPFILVTGAVTEDRAIEILTGGAKDYVMKNRLSRLAPAVRRAFTEAGEHRARKEAEEELRVASLYSRSLLEASLDPLVTISPDGKVMDVNKATEEATGVSRDQIIGNDFADYFTEPEKARAGYEKAFSNGSLKDFPLVLRHISGRITDVLYNATTYKNEKGEIQGIFAAARDVTELKAAEAELRETHKILEEQVRERTHELQESKERLNLALTSSGMGIFEWDIIKNKRCFDENTFLLLGIKPESFTGTAEEFFSVIHPDDRQAVQNALNRATEESSLYETDYRVIWPDGSTHHIAVRGRVQRNKADRPIRLAGVCWEITERRRTQDRLQRQAELLNMSYEAIFMWEHDGAIIYWNKRAEQLYGYSSEEAVGQVSHDLLKTRHTKGMGYVKDILTRNTTWSGELIHTTKDGKTLTVESRFQLTKDEFGRLIVLETNRDITERKKAEEALRQSEERFRTMANSIQQLAWIARADGFIFWYNERWYEYTGTTPEQMEGWGWQSVHDPELLPAVMKKWKMSLATGEPFDMEFPLLGADGVFRPFLTRGMPLRDDQGRVIQWFGTNTDLSDRKREEEELQKKAGQLEAANKEVEGFSYSVSLPLKEG
jgi:PAS domain S-box-containing protein